ncbi:MAG: helix-turn-helix domain-containing protein [Brachymonas sp.]|nr:helix-turn-helix domain-containing protein [Brachymonas sp.]
MMIKPQASASPKRPSEDNQVLLRGLMILRSFAPGWAQQSHSEIMGRTGLPKATVSRLLKSLVAFGWLNLDTDGKTYRLSPVLLVQAHTLRQGLPWLEALSQLMQSVSSKHSINVGLAYPDGLSMVYVETVRTNKRWSSRQIVAGQRIPIESTALGQAYLASLQPDALAEMLSQIKASKAAKSEANWNALREEIYTSILRMQSQGFCYASWQSGVLAVATSLVTPQGVYSLNVSVPNTQLADTPALDDLASILLAMKQKATTLVLGCV